MDARKCADAPHSGSARHTDGPALKHADGIWILRMHAHHNHWEHWLLALQLHERVSSGGARSTDVRMTTSHLLCRTITSRSWALPHSSTVTAPRPIAAAFDRPRLPMILFLRTLALLIL